jgi:hypothetical protein
MGSNTFYPDADGPYPFWSNSHTKVILPANNCPDFKVRTRSGDFVVMHYGSIG